MPGGWNYQAYISPYESYIFYRTMDEEEDYFYVPVAVATQIVNGTNYRFLTIAEPKNGNGTPYFALVEMQNQKTGMAHLILLWLKFISLFRVMPASQI